MTIVPTLLISRDLCWKRKLWRHFEDVRFYFDYPLVHILEIPIYYMIDIQLSKKMNFYSVKCTGGRLENRIESNVFKDWIFRNENW